MTFCRLWTSRFGRSPPGCQFGHIFHIFLEFRQISGNCKFVHNLGRFGHEGPRAAQLLVFARPRTLGRVPASEPCATNRSVQRDTNEGEKAAENPGTPICMMFKVGRARADRVPGFRAAFGTTRPKHGDTNFWTNGGPESGDIQWPRCDTAVAPRVKMAHRLGHAHPPPAPPNAPTRRRVADAVYA